MKLRLPLSLASALLIAGSLFAWQGRYAPNYKRTSLPLTEGSEALMAKLVDLDRYPPVSGKDLHIADLNEDGKPDYIVCAGWGGCGLAAGACELHIFLSAPDGCYRTRMQVHSFEPQDILRVNGKNYLLLTLFQYWSTEDGHNYWLHRIYSFGKDGRLREADAEIGPPFPSFIRYLSRENHEEAKLSPETKRRMWETAKQKLFSDPTKDTEE